jgi:hypothetical protein|tara:strand:- start:5437 stop:5862 length:426 start_codon:yes stop_codon:yes gene_type:complete
MDNCNYNLSSSFTRFGANDTTNCQLKIKKETFNRYNNTLTQKQIYSNIANRIVPNFSVCIQDISSADIDKIIDTDSDSEEPPSRPDTIPSPPDSPTPPDNSVLSQYSLQATQLVSVIHPDQIPDIDTESSYPSCSYKSIKF